jgi:hypothetical protein
MTTDVIARVRRQVESRPKGFVAVSVDVADLEDLLTALESARHPYAVTVPRLTGCCQWCGLPPTITMGPVNETVCIAVVARCNCSANFHLWPMAPHASVTE